METTHPLRSPADAQRLAKSIAQYRKGNAKARKQLDMLRSPCAGVGKPEPLREHLAGFWSRRIDSANRLVYVATDDELVIIACRYHY